MNIRRVDYNEGRIQHESIITRVALKVGAITRSDCYDAMSDCYDPWADCYDPRSECYDAGFRIFLGYGEYSKIRHYRGRYLVQPTASLLRRLDSPTPRDASPARPILAPASLAVVGSLPRLLANLPYTAIP